MFQKAGMLSPEGRCKTLDATADGYVRAEALGTMVMALLGAVAGERSHGCSFPPLPVNSGLTQSALECSNFVGC